MRIGYGIDLFLFCFLIVVFVYDIVSYFSFVIFFIEVVSYDMKLGVIIDFRIFNIFCFYLLLIFLRICLF